MKLSEPMYSVVVRGVCGGGWCPVSGTKNLEKAIRVANEFFEYGGYYTIVKTQYIDGKEFLPVVSLVTFMGSEKEFIRNNKMTLSEYEEKLQDTSNFSYKVAKEF